MNTQFVSTTDWFAFEKSHPDAARFLRKANLCGEYSYLAKLDRRNNWQQRRLEELAAHFSSVKSYDPNYYSDNYPEVIHVRKS